MEGHLIGCLLHEMGIGMPTLQGSLTWHLGSAITCQPQRTGSLELFPTTLSTLSGAQWALTFLHAYEVLPILLKL